MLCFMRACILVFVVVGVVFFRKCSLMVMEVECSGVGFWLVGGGIYELSGFFFGDIGIGCGGVMIGCGEC